MELHHPALTPEAVAGMHENREKTGGVKRTIYHIKRPTAGGATFRLLFYKKNKKSYTRRLKFV